MNAVRQNIKNPKTLNILYNLVDNTLRKEDIIKRIGQERYDYYYPLYLITKNRLLRRQIRHYQLRIRKNGQRNFYLKSTTITQEDFKYALEDCAPKQLKKWVASLDEEDFIEIQVCGLKNEKEWLYDELYLVECCVDGVWGNIPVVLENVNTSSGIAMWSCGLEYREDEEGEYDEGENTYSIPDQQALTYRQVAKRCMKGWDTGTAKFLYKNYVNYHFRSREEQEEEMRKACEVFSKEKKSGCLL
jgi:hypothetical protein